MCLSICLVRKRWVTASWYLRRRWNHCFIVWVVFRKPCVLLVASKERSWRLVSARSPRPENTQKAQGCRLGIKYSVRGLSQCSALPPKTFLMAGSGIPICAPAERPETRCSRQCFSARRFLPGFTPLLLVAILVATAIDKRAFRKTERNNSGLKLLIYRRHGTR